MAGTILGHAFHVPPGAGGGRGIALINSMGALGGFVGPYLIGRVRERTGEFAPALLLLAGSLVAAAIIVLCLRSSVVHRAREAAHSE